MNNASPVNAHIENVLLAVIIQLIVIIVAARVAGWAFRKIGQPQVCGEIAAGLILGPSLLGGLFPGLFAAVFPSSIGPIFSIMSQLGLVLLMFLIGLEFDFGHLSENRRMATAVSLTGMLLPFVLGFGLGQFLHAQLALTVSSISFSLFMAVAMSITAIPILGRIMMELNLNRTRLGAVTISAAAIDDAGGWILLAFVSAIAKSQFDPAKLGIMIVEVLAFAAFMMFVVRPAVIRWIRSGFTGELNLNSLAAILIMVLLSAITTNLIGIFSIFGAFFFGAILHDQPELVAAIRARLNDFVTVFFLPIFFTYTGLRTDIGSMTGSTLWIFCGMVLAAAVIGKFGGCTIAARLSGFPWRESAMVGVMMNTRALMELIVINMGYDLGIIPKSVFFMLVFMAVFTTYMTAPILRRLVMRSEVEAHYVKSAFAARA